MKLEISQFLNPFMYYFNSTVNNPKAWVKSFSILELRILRHRKKEIVQRKGTRKTEKVKL